MKIVDRNKKRDIVIGNMENVFTKFNSEMPEPMGLGKAICLFISKWHTSYNKQDSEGSGG